MRKIIIVTGASNGIGKQTCKHLALAGHAVYASMGDTKGRNAGHAAHLDSFARQNNLQLRTIDIDVSSQTSVDAVVKAIIDENGRLDVVVHNAGHIVYGPAEAFTAEQLGELFDTNVVSAQRVNRAALPQLRKRGEGLLVWLSSSGARGGTPPFLGIYSATKASMDALALCYAGELARWGIETTIIVPRSLGADHYIRSGRPRDRARAEEYGDGPTCDLSETALKGVASLSPRDTNAQDIAAAIATTVDLPFGERPLRIHFDPDDDGAVTVDQYADQARADLFRRIGVEDILKPAIFK
ncbi:SDR family oxidoreductase [Tardiphaga sp. 866_E4_N2_1]|uniref:SDR family oxidoreductase n=1 Tax=unclassified Tardiphaga TaxID=2631404 RepID=UPI003F231780